MDLDIGEQLHLLSSNSRQVHRDTSLSIGELLPLRAGRVLQDSIEEAHKIYHTIYNNLTYKLLEIRHLEQYLQAGLDQSLDHVRESKQKICHDIIYKSQQFLEILSEKKPDLDSEAFTQALYYQFRADCLANISKVVDRKQLRMYVQSSQQCYRMALELSQDPSLSQRLLRLSIIQKMAVLQAEIKRDYRKAVQINQSVLDQTRMMLIAQYQGPQLNKIRSIYALSRDNCTLWTWELRD